MHRNTFLLVAGLAVFAALVVGVNIGTRMSTAHNQQFINQPTADTVSTPIPTPTQKLSTAMLTTYTSAYCGITFDYPERLQKLEGATGSAIFTDTNVASSSILLTCQRDIPRPPILADKIESVVISSVSAKLYHDTSDKDGRTIDKLIFRHPKTGLDIFLAGTGEIFKKLISSITLLP